MISGNLTLKPAPKWIRLKWMRVDSRLPGPLPNPTHCHPHQARPWYMAKPPTNRHLLPTKLLLNYIYTYIYIKSDQKNIYVKTIKRRKRRKKERKEEHWPASSALVLKIRQRDLEANPWAPPDSNRDRLYDGSQHRLWRGSTKMRKKKEKQNYWKKKPEKMTRTTTFYSPTDYNKPSSSIDLCKLATSSLIRN